jgi:hypothetical protein
MFQASVGSRPHGPGDRLAGAAEPVRYFVSVNNPGTDCHLPGLADVCRRVPRLHAYTAGEGRVYLVLDGRLGLELSEAEACAVVPFIADCVELALRSQS